MAKVQIVDDRTMHKQLYNVNNHQFFTSDGKMYCKLNSYAQKNVFSVLSGNVEDMDRHTQCLPVVQFTIKITE